MTNKLIKKLSLLMAVILIAGLFCGCGAKGGEELQAASSKESGSSAGAAEKSEERKEKSAAGSVFDLAVFDDAKHIDLDKETSPVKISKAGNYVLTGKMKGQVVVDTNEVENVKIILAGAEIENEGDACIYVKNAKKTVLASAEGTVNSLTSTGEFKMPDANNVDATVFSQDDLNMNGDGIINIRSERGHGVVSKDELKMKDGEVNITAYKKGFCGKDALTCEGGKLNVESRTHAMYSEGEINISGGEYTLVSHEKDGIHSVTDVVISGGTITVQESSEGIEGLTVTISGGEVDITSNDDGINSSAMSNDGNSQWQIGGDQYLTDDGADITISGGKVHINSVFDGIDSNGSFNMTGGELFIDGPDMTVNAAVDYSGEALISGGRVVAAGPAGMAQGFCEGSTQGSILFNSEVDFPAGTEIDLYDTEGNILISFAPAKKFSSVLVSCEGIDVGSTYVLSIGKLQAQIYMSSVIYSTMGKAHEMLPAIEG